MEGSCLVGFTDHQSYLPTTLKTRIALSFEKEK
jgi:hypothetical protein